MTQNVNFGPSFQLGGNSYGDIRIQHYQYYQKLCSPHKKSEIRGFAGRANLDGYTNPDPTPHTPMTHPHQAAPAPTHIGNRDNTRTQTITTRSCLASKKCFRFFFH